MTRISWDPKARDFLRKLPKVDSKRIVRKVVMEIMQNPKRYLDSVIGKTISKIRIGNYRLFVDYDEAEDHLWIRSIRHRRNAYK